MTVLLANKLEADYKERKTMGAKQSIQVSLMSNLQMAIESVGNPHI